MMPIASKYFLNAVTGCNRGQWSVADNFGGASSVSASEWLRRIWKQVRTFHEQTEFLMPPLKIDYIEIQSPALPDSKAFFAKAFGWSFTDYGPHYASFTGAGIDGGFDGGFEHDETARPRSVLIVLKADDLAAAERAVLAAGGEIVKPTYAFPGGRRFHFREPGGNELAVWSET
jgi:uncharacterized protein